MRAPVPVPPIQRNPEEQRGVRVWLALHELARSEVGRGNDGVDAAIEEARSVERQLVHRQLERWIGARVAEVDAARVCALSDGLRFQLVGPTAAPIDATAAAAILRDELDRVRLAGGPPRARSNDPPDTTAGQLPYM